MRLRQLLFLTALAGATGLGACMDATGPQFNGAGTAQQLKSLSGTELSGDAGFVLESPVKVQVVDASGKGVAGETVSFAVVDGGGSVTPASAVTDSGGIATAQWTLGRVAGTNTLKVSHGSTSVTIRATGAEGRGTTILKISGGTTDSLPAGCTIQAPLVVQVMDASNKPVAGAKVGFETVAGDGRFSEAEVTTGSDGMASTRWSVGFQGGSNVARAVLHSAAKPSVEFSARSAPAAPNGFSVIGNRIYSPTSCAPTLFHGAARPSLEWWFGGDEEFANIGQQVAMLKGWGANVLRLPVSQTFWLPGNSYYTGLNGGLDYSAAYKARVIDAVAKARATGLNVIIDLHATDRGDPNYAAVPDIWQMPDAVRSVQFWREVATQFKDDGGVIFELYNEPHPREYEWQQGVFDEAAWNIWLNGGDIPAGPDYPGDPAKPYAYKAAGMQTLYDVVRGTGARNLVIVGGSHWGYELNGVPTHRVKGYNIAYSSHPYDWADKQEAAWESDFGSLAATDPVIISEFGSYQCNRIGYNKAVLDYADAKGLSWVAWRFWTPPPASATYTTAQRTADICGTSSLLLDWNGTPSASGQLVKDRLASYRTP